MRYHIVVRKGQWPDGSKAYAAEIRNESDDLFLNITFLGDSKGAAAGKAIYEHPECFPDLIVEK